MHKPRGFALQVDQQNVLGVLLASAYPDRVARRRDNGGSYQLANGRSAPLPQDDALGRNEWLAVADTGGQQVSAVDNIFSAASLDPACFKEVLSPLVREEELVEWDNREERFVAQRRRMVGNILLASEPLADVSSEARGQALLGVIRRRGLDILPWNPSLDRWRARVNLLHRVSSTSDWPDLGDDALLESLEDWLLPYLDDVRRLNLGALTFQRQVGMMAMLKQIQKMAGQPVAREAAGA